MDMQLYPWEQSTYYPLYGRLVGSQSQSECVGRRDKSLLLPAIDPIPWSFSLPCYYSDSVFQVYLRCKPNTYTL